MLLGHCTFILSIFGHFRSGPFLADFQGTLEEPEFDSQKKTDNQLISPDKHLI